MVSYVCFVDYVGVVIVCVGCFYLEVYVFVVDWYFGLVVGVGGYLWYGFFVGFVVGVLCSCCCWYLVVGIVFCCDCFEVVGNFVVWIVGGGVVGLCVYLVGVFLYCFVDVEGFVY